MRLKLRITKRPIVTLKTHVRIECNHYIWSVFYYTYPVVNIAESEPKCVSNAVFCMLLPQLPEKARYEHCYFVR